jgi:ribosomal protein S18 acetylase RimI-like enzyme
MTDHPHQLYALAFTEADHARLAGFACGDEAWSRSAAEWIRGSDVLDSMKKGTKVWLFENAGGEIVGFGSVGPARWRWPLPDGAYSQLVMIPMLGVAARFQGQPPDPEWRYARQIISHLISVAMEMSRGAAVQPGSSIDWLVLLVHRDNRRAIKFYENCGFELIPDVVRSNNHLVMKLWIGATESDASQP